VPIYEYYCDVCHGRFSHLARGIDAGAPPCPRCGNERVERTISAANMVRGSAHHRGELRQSASLVDREDSQAMANFLKASGRLEDASGLYGSRAYRELIDRRAEGAADSDLADLVDDLAAAAATTEAAQMAASAALSQQMENRMAADGPPVEHGTGHGPSAVAESVNEAAGPDSDARDTRSPRSAPDLGWG